LPRSLGKHIFGKFSRFLGRDIDPSRAFLPNLKWKFEAMILIGGSGYEPL